MPANFTAATVPELVGAIDASNQTPEADTIALVAGTTFTLTQVNNTTHGPTALPVILPGGLTLVGNDDIVERSTAAGTPTFRLIDVVAGASLTLKNLTLQGGQAVGSFVSGSEWSQGGAIYNQGTLALDGVTVQNNAARGSDGIPWGGHLNATDGRGGGVYSDGTLTLTGCTIRDNTAVGGHGVNANAPKPPKGFGGADPHIGVVVGGRGGNGLGGGLFIAGGTLSISSSTIVGNTAQGGDGGNGYQDSTGKRTAGGDGGDGMGGGVYAAGGTVEFHLVNVTDNHALGGTGGSTGGKAGKGQGGGLYLAPGVDAGLDAYTVDHTTNNDASGNSKNIFGGYDLIS